MHVMLWQPGTTQLYVTCQVNSCSLPLAMKAGCEVNPQLAGKPCLSMCGLHGMLMCAGRDGHSG